MNFGELVQIEAKTRDLKNQRISQANQSLEQGLDLLAQAEAEHFADKQRLRRSLDCFLTAIRAHRTAPEAYFAAAYVFELVQDFNMAMAYVAAVRDFQPEHPDLPVWFSHLQTAAGNQTPASRTHAAGQAPEPGTDSDHLLEDLRTELVALLRSWKSLPAPEPEPAMLEALQAEQHLLAKSSREFSLRVQLVERELDTLGLRSLLKRLDQRLTELTGLQAVIRKMIQIREGAQQLATEVKQQRRLPLNTDTLARLESALDQCDGYADQLDLLDTAGYDIAPVKVYYRDLLQAVALWQEMLDEA